MGNIAWGNGDRELVIGNCSWGIANLTINLRKILTKDYQLMYQISFWEVRTIIRPSC
jgi:hypothetical protein